jgi:hypothetical protein
VRSGGSRQVFSALLSGAIDRMNAGGRATQLLRPPANETIQVTL